MAQMVRNTPSPIQVVVRVLGRMFRGLLVVGSPFVIWYVGNVFADMLHMGDLSQLSRPQVLSRLLLPGVLAANAWPLWVDVAIGLLMLALFAACVIADVQKAPAIIQVVFLGAGSARQQSSRRQGGRSLGTAYVWLFLLLISIGVILVARPMPSDLSALVATASLTGIALLLVVAGAAAIVLSNGIDLLTQHSEGDSDTGDKSHVPVPGKRKLEIPEKMPTLERVLSRNASRSRRITHMTLFLALVLIGISTVASAFHTQSPYFVLFNHQMNALTTVSAALFTLAAGICLYSIYAAPERVWYGSRALAQDIRSLTWRYAVAGVPFAWQGTERDDADERFHHALHETTVEANRGGIQYSKPSGTEEIRAITDWMRQVRSVPLDQRVRIYGKERIHDREQWYATQARRTNRAATISKWILLAVEIAGAVLAALVALAVVNLDLVGVAGTIAAGVAAWVQFNWYARRASIYGAMAYRMASYRERCLSQASPWTADLWAAFVGEVEDTLRRER